MTVSGLRHDLLLLRATYKSKKGAPSLERQPLGGYVSPAPNTLYTHKKYCTEQALLVYRYLLRFQVLILANVVLSFSDDRNLTCNAGDSDIEIGTAADKNVDSEAVEDPSDCQLLHLQLLPQQHQLQRDYHDD